MPNLIQCSPVQSVKSRDTLPFSNRSTIEREHAFNEYNLEQIVKTYFVTCKKEKNRCDGKLKQRKYVQYSTYSMLLYVGTALGTGLVPMAEFTSPQSRYNHVIFNYYELKNPG